MLSKGFTLIELLITVSVIAVLTAATIPNFVTYAKNQALSQAQEQMLNDLRTTQNKALTGSLAEATYGATDKKVLFWGLNLVNSSDYYAFVQDNDTSCPNGTFEAGQQQAKFTMPQGISLTPVQTCFFFEMYVADLSVVGNPWFEIHLTDASGTSKHLIMGWNGNIDATN